MTELDVINKALMKCGLPLAATIGDCDWNASIVFDSARDECLRSFAWNFAMRFVSLARQGAPAFGYRYAYALPADCVRVIDVHCMNDMRSPKARYSVSGRQLYTHAQPCYLRYVSRNVDVEDWPTDFADAAACRIAMEIAPLSTQSVGMAAQLAPLYQAALAMAQAADARESAERVPHDHNIMLARAGYEHVGRRG